MKSAECIINCNNLIQSTRRVRAENNIVFLLFSALLLAGPTPLVQFHYIQYEVSSVVFISFGNVTIQRSPPGMNPDQQTSGHVVWLHSIEFVYHEGFYVSKWSNRGAKVKLWNPVGNDKINATNRIG